ncbi:hypothetical protein HNY73_020199 [Argiope bruennichi]|uniref:Uncharacterized protein n=1 Tax=Argiope bruennichi TaxID=94029 RepID=A0A8T0E604_ARGBR|nr:hypothetical protein HNY73_020199 [Argiope bruennichi]
MLGLLATETSIPGSCPRLRPEACLLAFVFLVSCFSCGDRSLNTNMASRLPSLSERGKAKREPNKGPKAKRKPYKTNTTSITT